VAPLDGGAQRLLPAWRSAVAIAGEHAQAFGHGGQELVEPEQPHPGRGQFDGQRVAVELPAQFHDRRHLRVGQHEAAIGRLCAFGKQRHGAEGLGLPGRQRTLRHGQPGEPHHAFLGQLQRRLAGDEQAQPRRRSQQPLHQRSHLGQAVLGVVQRQQHLPGGQRLGQRRQRVAGCGLQAQCGGQGAGQRALRAQRGEFHPAHPVGGRAGAQREQRLGQARLADAARPHQRDEPVLLDERGAGGQVLAAADEQRRRHRQVGARGRRRWRRGRPVLRQRGATKR
jgi:hypothetical protein